MHQFLDKGFVVKDTTTYEEWQYIDEFLNEIPKIRISGEIACLGRILITVDKTLDILQGSGDNRVVQTSSYGYNVSLQGQGNIFRYDNQDDIFMYKKDHLDDHHKHCFDLVSGKCNVIWIGEKNWPILDQVIREAESWYWSNKTELLLPEVPAETGKGWYS